MNPPRSSSVYHVNPQAKKMAFIYNRKARLLVALLVATFAPSCYGGGGGWGGGGYYPNSYYSNNNYYSRDVYRGYGGYAQPGLFGGYPPAHEAWAASSRGRASYGEPHERGGGHPIVVHGGGGGGRSVVGEHGGGNSHGH